MATFKRFEEIVAWQLARQLAQEIERIARKMGLAKDLRLRNHICDSSNPVLKTLQKVLAEKEKRNSLISCTSHTLPAQKPNPRFRHSLFANTSPSAGRESIYPLLPHQ
jgi:hypothetical protein